MIPASRVAGLNSLASHQGPPFHALDILQVGGGAEDRIVQREFDELSHVDQTLQGHTSTAAR